MDKDDSCQVKEPALSIAEAEFGYSSEDIINFIKEHLDIKYFARSNEHKSIPGVMVDHYEVETSEHSKYFHFHIRNDILFITSLKPNSKS